MKYYQIQIIPTPKIEQVSSFKPTADITVTSNFHILVSVRRRILKVSIFLTPSSCFNICFNIPIHQMTAEIKEKKHKLG